MTRSFFCDVPIAIPVMLNPSHFRTLLRTRYCGRHLLQFCQLDSTNRLLAEWIGQSQSCDRPMPEGTTAIATRQMGGRGQRGHEWISEAGGLYASVLLYPDVEARRLLELTLTIAWGITVQLRDCWELDVRLKWPNDLMVEGRKLGGVLLQAQLQGGRVRSVVVGVGLNGYNPTPEIGIALSDLRDWDIHLDEVAAEVLAGIERGYEAWKTEGLAGLEPSYPSLMLYCERTIELMVAERSEEVTVLGIGSDGRLQVDMRGHIEVFQPGQIQLGYGETKPAANG